MENIKTFEFTEVFETVFQILPNDILYAIDRKDNLIKPFTDTQQYADAVKLKKQQ